jgi:hypothetical protein
LILSADRLDTPLIFRFQSGSFEFDNRALRDIGRLSTQLSDPEFSEATLIPVGFADPKDDAMTNVHLFQQRAL